MNEGKVFENDFIKSIPEHVFKYRLKDAGGWNRGEDTRFTSSNICDFIVMYGTNLFLLELKSNKGKSMSINNLGQKTKDKKLSDLIEAGSKSNVISGYVINFREIEETYFITANNFKELVNITGKKSVNRNDLVSSGNAIKINQEKIRVRSRYDVVKFLEEATPF